MLTNTVLVVIDCDVVCFNVSSVTEHIQGARCVFTGGAGADDSDLLPSMIQRPLVLSRVKNLSFEFVLWNCSATNRVLMGVRTYGSWDDRHIGLTTSEASGEDEVSHDESTLSSVCSLDCDVPLVRRVLGGFKNIRRGPDIELERVGVVLQPVCKLETACSEEHLLGKRSTYLQSRGVDRPCWRKPGGQ